MMSSEQRKKVVVVGGGIIGLSVLYNLATNGLQDVSLLEKSRLTNGSTWHASGELGFAGSDPAHLGFLQHSAALYESLDKGSGGQVGWCNTGGLKLAFNAEEEHQLAAQVEIGRSYGNDLRMISVGAAAQLHPFLDFEGVKACLYSKQDGNVDPHGTSMVLAQNARELGAEIRENTQVKGIEQSRSAGWILEIEDGQRIHADCVVLAPGCYARQIAEWFDVYLPVHAFMHHYFITDRVPDLAAWRSKLPIVRDEDCGGYVRRDADGLLIGTTENRIAEEVWETGVPWHEQGTLFAPDYESVEHLLNAAVRRFPMIAEIGLKTVVRGAVTYTPDSRMFLGALVPERNLWIAAGASSGVAWAGGIGACLADQICGYPSRFDMKPFDPNRFRETDPTILRNESTKAFLARGSTRITS